MDISDIKKIEFIPSSDTRANIRFIKNEEGKRTAQQLTDSDVEKNQEEKKPNIIVVGHIEHIQTAIIEALERSDYQGKIVLVT